jgi:hypothetical protein
MDRQSRNWRFPKPAVLLRRASRIGAILLLMVPLITVASLPASAEPPVRACEPYVHELVCVDRLGWTVWGYVADPDGVSTFEGGASLVVALRQCHGDGTNCVPISAANEQITPPRNMIPGHTYQTVASWVHTGPGARYAANSVFSPFTYRPCPC